MKGPCGSQPLRLHRTELWVLQQWGKWPDTADLLCSMHGYGINHSGVARVLAMNGGQVVTAG